jgi:hypothetical protein
MGLGSQVYRVRPENTHWTIGNSPERPAFKPSGSGLLGSYGFELTGPRTARVLSLGSGGLRVTGSTGFTGKTHPTSWKSSLPRLSSPVVTHQRSFPLASPGLSLGSSRSLPSYLSVSQPPSLISHLLVSSLCLSTLSISTLSFGKEKKKRRTEKK